MARKEKKKKVKTFKTSLKHFLIAIILLCVATAGTMGYLIYNENVL